MWPIKTILYALYFVAMCLWSLINPIVGVMNYMLVYQVEPQANWWGLPFRDLGIRFSLLAASFLVVGIALGKKPLPQRRATGYLWEVGVVAIVVLAFSGAANATMYTGQTRASLDKLWKLMVFILILGRLVTTRRNLRWMIWAIVIGTLYLGYQGYDSPSSRFVLGRLNDLGGADFRESSGLAVHIAAMLPLVGIAFMITRRWGIRLIALAAGAFGIDTLILCRTRSAFLGLIAGISVAAFVAPRGRRARIYVLLLLCGGIGYSLTDRYFWDRMMTITDVKSYDNDQAIVMRREVWHAGIAMIQDHPFGVGAGNFSRRISNYIGQPRSAHNSFLNCAAELGLHTFLIFLLMVISGFWRLRFAMRNAHLLKNPMEIKIVAYGFLVSIVTYVVAGCFTARFYAESFWWVLTFPLCLERTVAAELYARERLATFEIPELFSSNNGFCWAKSKIANAKNRRPSHQLA